MRRWKTKVTIFAFTFLTETARSNIPLTVTATFSDESTSVVNTTINLDRSNPPTKDTFFGFVAPSGTWIVSVAIHVGTTTSHVTCVDDVGFITSVVP